MQFNLRKAIQLAYWDRGRPARTEREARKALSKNKLRACGAVWAGRPRSEYDVAAEIKLHY